MKIETKNVLWLGFFLSIFLLVGYWSWVILSWMIKETHYNLLFIFPIIILSILISIPSFKLTKIIIKILKNVHEKNKFSKSLVRITSVMLIFSITFGFVIPLIYRFQSEYKYDDGPYLIWNDDPKSTMTILWMTKEPEIGELKYGILGKYKNPIETIVECKYSTLHMIKLINLDPDTKYFYKIPALGDKIFTFKTAPDDLDKAFNFILIGDNRQDTLEQSAYDEVIETMKPYNYEFIINSGDIVEAADGTSFWHDFFSQMTDNGKNHPYMIAIGNHDTGKTASGLSFKDFFPYNYAHPPDFYYSFDYSNAHFVILDNYDVSQSGSDFISDKQKEWLCEDLNNNRDKWLFVVTHIPPYSTGHHNMNQDLIAQLCPIFYKYEVDVVLSGHDHHYEAFWVNRTEDWGGTHYFVSGGAGAPIYWDILQRELYPWKNNWHNASIDPYQKDYVTLHDQLYGELCNHFVYFEVKPTILHVKAIRADGTLIQEIFISKNSIGS